MSEITSRWTGGPYYLTPEQRRTTREMFERGVKQPLPMPYREKSEVEE